MTFVRVETACRPGCVVGYESRLIRRVACLCVPSSRHPMAEFGQTSVQSRTSVAVSDGGSRPETREGNEMSNILCVFMADRGFHVLFCRLKDQWNATQFSARRCTECLHVRAVHDIFGHRSESRMPWRRCLNSGATKEAKSGGLLTRISQGTESIGMVMLTYRYVLKVHQLCSRRSGDSTVVGLASGRVIDNS